MVRLGIIGCGKITERACLPNLKDHPNVKIEILCDIRIERAKELVKKFDLKDVRIIDDWRRLVKSKDIDAVYIATPNYLHSKMVISCAENKKEILVEKPMATSLEDAEKMVRAVEKNKVILMVEQSQRFDPTHQAAKKILESNILGEIHNIYGRIGHAGPEYWSKESDWFYDKRKSGGGAIMDIGVHILDLLLWFKRKRIRRVFCQIEKLEKKINLEDNATALLEFEDGTKGSFECSWTTRPYEVNTFIYGKKGKMITSLGAEKPVVVNLATIGKDKDPNCLLTQIYPEISEGSAWRNAIYYFIDCVETKQKPFVNVYEGRETVKVILACYESVKRKKWVEL